MKRWREKTAAGGERWMRAELAERARNKALAEARLALAEGRLFRTDYVMLDGVMIAYVDANGKLCEVRR